MNESGRIWPCILLHGAYNTAITAIYISIDNEAGREALLMSPMLWMVTIILGMLGLFFFQRLLVSSQGNVAPLLVGWAE